MVDVVTNHMGYDGCQTCVDYSVFNPFNEVGITDFSHATKLTKISNRITMIPALSTMMTPAQFKYAGKVTTLFLYQIYALKILMYHPSGTLGSPSSWQTTQLTACELIVLNKSIKLSSRHFSQLLEFIFWAKFSMAILPMSVLTKII